MTKQWAWISGWGIAPERFSQVCQQAFPAYTHTVFAPTEHAVEAILAIEADRLGAYSLGTLLLLEAIDQIPSNTPLFLYAPILGFTQEMGLGGTTPLASLKMIQKRLQQSPEKALKLFYRLAELKETIGETLPYPLKDLSWGLDALAKKQVNPPHGQKIMAFCGERDTLIDCRKMSQLLTTPQLLPHGHDFRQLLADDVSLHAR